MTEPIDRKTEARKRTNPEGSADGAEATSTPKQRAVLERFLKLKDSRSDAPPEQPAITGASTSNASSGFRLLVPSRTLNQAPASRASSVQDRGSSFLFTSIHPASGLGRIFARKCFNYLSEHHFAA